jgi:predicted dehydrogenase
VKKHTIILAGLGKRGKIHLKGILENPERFELLGVYDPAAEAVHTATERFKLDCPIFSSAEEMLSKTKPEIFAFATHPDIRLEYVRLGIKYGVRGLSFEKPMATSLSDAREMTRLCVDNGIQAIISHQQKYMTQMQRIYECVSSGIIGVPELIRIFMLPWASQLGTHFVDYALWVNGGVGAEWVVGHIHGRLKLTDNHPSPDYILGEARLKNGATLLIEGGYLAPHTMPDEEFWCNNRITVYGDHGYAWAETNGRYGIFSPDTGGKVEIGQYPKFVVQQEGTQTPYYADYADWLDDDSKKHSCNIEISLHGFEIIEALYKSALENIRVDIPIQGKEIDAITEMKKTLPEQKYPAGFEDGSFYKQQTERSRSI